MPEDLDHLVPIHALTAIARLMKNSFIRAQPHSTLPGGVQWVLQNYAEVILKLTTEWSQFDAADNNTVQRKVEELMWTSALIYGISGYRGEGKEFNADFFMWNQAGNPWFEILSQSLTNNDDHLVKIQRVLAYCASAYPGDPSFHETELPGAENVDATLWLRVAALTAARVGKNTQGKLEECWDFVGYFE
ncbi:hypothetical protein V5O48_008884 [Marasmius crinis-equi]|uniref:Uncharacterized protein n=1 Tax=Marasmius crinis-equi TaxID=585013 RepID=A0ABR3FCN3_9AGAR